MTKSPTFNNISYGIFEYDTKNIGDEIQSIAARRFLPKIDCYVNRDQLKNFKIPESLNSSTMKLIMNGWYTMNPTNWPLLDQNITPLLISVHVNQNDPEVIKSFKSKKSLQFLKKNGPVGARDLSTLDFFKKNDIPAYFSGCMTLTLIRDDTLPRKDFILTVDISDNLVNYIKNITKRPVINISVYHGLNLSTEARFKLAEYYLYLYQSAHCVFATRLHSILPSLAFKTPVLLIKENGKYDVNRYGGLDCLVNSISEEEFINNPEIFNIECPPKNKDNYIKYRNLLINKTKSFTGFDASPSSYRSIAIDKSVRDNDFMNIFSELILSSGQKNFFNGEIKYLKNYISEQDILILKNKSEIDYLKNKPIISFAIKLTSIIDKIHKKLRYK